ncbi:MAG: hypothetical protein ABI351_07660 [Herbaspirillum sp.]
MVAGAYFLAATAGMLLASSGIFGSTLWPATGLVLAVLLRGGLRC